MRFRAGSRSIQYVRWIGIAVLVAAVAIAGCGSGAGSTGGARRGDAQVPAAPTPVSARRLRPRPGAVAPGTVVPVTGAFTLRVFANRRDGFTLANDGSAQYPAISDDGGRTWRIDGPQVHVDAADGAEGVGYVGIAGPHAFFAYGSSAVDVTTNSGRTWWETLLDGLVVAVVPGLRSGTLVAFVQDSLSDARTNPAVTWPYVSRDGGRHWIYSTALGG